METAAIKQADRATASGSSSRWLLLASLPVGAFCSACVLLGVVAPTDIVGRHSRYTEHTAAGKARRNPYFLFFLSLLLRHTGHPGSVFVAFTARQQPRC